MLKLKIIILASGNGTLAQSIFDAGMNLEISLVISDQNSKVLERARKKGIESRYLPMTGDRELWNKELFDLVSSHNPDLVVSVGFMRILAPEFVGKFATINSHPALLPNFPGAHAVRDALRAGVSESGTTVHWVDEGVDTGAVIAQQSVSVLRGDSEESLHERIKIVERILIVATLQSFISNGMPERK